MENNNSGSSLTTAVGGILGRSVSHVDLDKENQQLRQALQEKDKIISKKELDKLAVEKSRTEETEKLEEKIKECEKKLAEGPDKKIAELEAKYKKEKTSLTAESKKQKEQKIQSDEARDALVADKADLKFKLTNLQSEMADLKSELESKQTDGNHQKQANRIQELEERNAALEKSLELFRQRGSQAAQIEQGQLILEHTKPLEGKLNNLGNENKQLKQGNFELQGEIGNLKIEKEGLEEKVRELDQERSESIKKIKTLEANNEESNNVCQSFQERNTALIKEQQISQKQLATLQVDLTQSTNKDKELLNVCSNFEKRNKQLIQEVQGLKKESDDKESQKRQPGSARKTLKPGIQGQTKRTLTLKMPDNPNDSSKSSGAAGTTPETPVTGSLHKLCKEDEQKKLEPSEVKRHSQQFTDVSSGTPTTPETYEPFDGERFNSIELEKYIPSTGGDTTPIVISVVREGYDTTEKKRVDLNQIFQSKLYMDKLIPKMRIADEDSNKDCAKPSLGRRRSQSNPNISSTNMQQVESVQEKNQNKNPSKTWASGWSK